MAESRPSLLEVLHAVREHYVEAYRGIIREQRAEGATMAVGVHILIGDGSNPHGSRFNLPMRLDLLLGLPDSPEPAKVEREDMLDFEPFTAIAPGDIPVQLEPFTWDDCDVVAEGDAASWDRMLAWFDRWFDREDQIAADDDGIAPVIHEMTEPLTEAGTVAFHVDFGAAPPEAFLDLLVSLHAQGLHNIRAGTLEIQSTS